MAESGGSEQIKRSRTMETPEKEDRLSALPDSLIQHILSFLPSTKQAIQTAILSKRWLNLWTLVPNLLFDFSDMSSDYSSENFPFTTSSISSIIDRVLILHDCSKLHKFHIISSEQYNFAGDPNCNAKLRFAIRKQAKELVLHFQMKEKFRLPDFFFRQDSLVNLQLRDCAIMPIKLVHWGNLTDLCLENCYYNDEVVTSILSGCPLLQSLEIRHLQDSPSSYQSNQLVISSKSLKRLFFLYVDCYFDIFCPKLVEFLAFSSMPQSLGWCDKVLENFLLDSPLLESLTFLNYELPNLRICSKLLKKLALWGVVSSEIEISCPNLEKLELAGLDVETIRLMNLPCSVSASLDNNFFFEDSEVNVAKQILEQLQHVKDLELGNSFVEILSDLEMSGVSCPLMKGKSLTLKSTSFEHIPGIVFALCSSPVLEILVVILEPDKSRRQKLSELSDLNRLEENCWNSNETHFGNLVSRLKNVRIFGLSEKEGKPKLVLDFVEFLLKNATMLENILVDVEGCGTGFVLKVSEKLLSFPRHSKATIKLDY